jgi:CTP synthase
MTKIIFITGGVVSSLGKGIIAASLGANLTANGYSVKIKKLDPYLNIDPGTMSPVQHGEVFVTDDGGETDLDLGHYERFINNYSSKYDNITSGKIYQKLLDKERKGDYMGKTVQVIPHVTDLIKEFILDGLESVDILICEIGGTVGDIEGQPFLEAIRQLRYQLGTKATLSIHATLLPYLGSSQELKTKPTQHSVRDLMSYGLMPDIIICRTSIPIGDDDRKKLSLLCNVKIENVIEAPDVDFIYDTIIKYHENGLTKQVMEHFHIHSQENLFINNISKWSEFISNVKDAKKSITIAIIGKYTTSRDSYKSIIESITHSSAKMKIKADVKIIDAKDDIDMNFINSVDGIIIAGGFGIGGVENKISYIRYARENNIPLLGICLGMQLSVIEFARNILDIKNATSSEFITDLENENAFPIVDLMENWQLKSGEIKNADAANIGGTMRLGSYDAVINDVKSLAFEVYKSHHIQERHRHRYEISLELESKMAEHGGIFSAKSPDGKLPEIFEIRKFKDKSGKWHDHKFFITCQFHPEFKSTPFNPSPLFDAFIKSACDSCE